MADSLKSIPNGNYYITPFYYTRERNPAPARTDPFGSEIKWRYTILAGKNYGTLTLVNSPTKCFYLPDVGTNTGLPNCNQTDNKQLFILTMDGKIYSIEKQAYLIPFNNPDKTGVAYTLNKNALVGQWLFSTVLPRRAGTISLWNTDVQYPVSVTDAENKWFDEKIGDAGNPAPGNNCDVSDRFICSCPKGLINVNCPAGQTSLTTQIQSDGTTRAFCHKSNWTDISKKELCASGDSSVIQNVPNKYQTADKLKLSDCKMLHPTNICSYTYNFKSDAWAPWTEGVKDTQAIKDFCSQHDTLLDLSFIESPTYKLTCGEWCDKNPDLCKPMKESYCNKYPNSRSCVSYCDESPENKAQCLARLQNDCRTSNDWSSPVCMELCQLQDVNCDADLLNYCNKADLNDPKFVEICGCFRENTFYSQYFADIRTKATIPPITPEIPICYFGRCSGSKLLPYSEKKTRTICPNISQCISQVTFDNNGKITGNIFINPSVECNQYLLPDKCPSDSIKDADGKCIKCGDGKVPNSEQTACIDKPVECKDNEIRNPTGACQTCPPGQIPNVARTECINQTCPNNYIKNSEGKCEVCPDGTKANGTQTECVKESSNFLAKNWIWILVGVIVLIIIFVIIVGSRKKKNIKTV